MKDGRKCQLNNLARNTRIILGKTKPGARKEGRVVQLQNKTLYIHINSNQDNFGSTVADKN